MLELSFGEIRARVPVPRFADKRARVPIYTPQLFAALFPVDFLALTLLALDPLPLGEVEPKRGRGQAHSTGVQSVSALPVA